MRRCTGICKWDDKRRQLAKVGVEWPRNATLSLNGAHAVQRLSPTDTTSALGQYIHYCNGYISSRVPADASSIADYNKFEILDPPPNMTWHCDTVNWNHFAGRYVCLGGDGGECTANRSAELSALPLHYSLYATMPVTVESIVHAGDKTVAFSHNLHGPYVNGSVVATHNASGSSCYNAVRFSIAVAACALQLIPHVNCWFDRVRRCTLRTST